MRSASSFAVLACLAGLAATGGAQTTVVNSTPYPYYSRAATAGESYARGLSDVVRSAGETNLRNSEAAINYTQARSQDLDNRLKGTNTYFEMRRVNKSYRDAERRPRATMEQMHRVAERGKPDRLSPSQLDPITGNINWPVVLRDDRYQAQLDEVQKQFTARATNSGVLGYQAYQELDNSVEQALAVLKDNIGDYKPADYIEAQKFLQSLAYEARFPAS